MSLGSSRARRARIMAFAGVLMAASLGMTTTASASDAITASFSPAAGLLSVDGDNANNEIVISRDAAGLLLINGGAVQIVGGVPTVANTSLIQMFGQGGNDTLTLDEASGALPAAEMFGGNGNDTLTGGAGGDRLFGENGNDTLLGKGGLDQLFGGDGNDTIDGNRGDDKSRMGAGDDTFIWDPGDGSDDVDGEDGSDKLLFNGANVAENIDVSARGNGRVRFFRDVASITMDLGTVEKIEFNALGGVDNIVVNDLQRGDTVELALSLEAQVGGVVGDGLADTVTVNGTNQADNVEVAGSETSYTVTGLPALVRVVGSEATDQLVLDVARGDDRVNAAALAAGVVKLTVDGGAGDDTIFGSRGADAFVGGSGDDTIDGNQADDVAHMGGGRDTFIWDPGDGSDTVEGQGGQDTLRFNGAGASENIDIAANGQRVRFFRDVANITMDLYEVQRIEFNALGGADNIVVNDLSGTDARDIKLDLAAVAGGGAGDGQADTVTVTGTNERDTVNISRPSGVVVRGLRADVEILGSEAANDQLKVNVLGGDDRVDADNLPAGSFVLLTMDGGDGTDRLIGSQGQDAAVNGEILVNIP